MSPAFGISRVQNSAINTFSLSFSIAAPLLKAWTHSRQVTCRQQASVNHFGNKKKTKKISAPALGRTQLRNTDDVVGPIAPVWSVAMAVSSWAVIRAQPEQGGDPASPHYRLLHVRHSGCGWPKCWPLVVLWSWGSFLVVLNNTITTSNSHDNKAWSKQVEFFFLPQDTSWQTTPKERLISNQHFIFCVISWLYILWQGTHIVFQRRQATDDIHCRYTHCNFYYFDLIILHKILHM